MEALFVFCTDAGTSPDGKLNITGVLSELYARSFPARQERMVLAGFVEWQRDVEGRIPFRMDLTDPEGLSVFTIEGHTVVSRQPVSSAPAKTQFILPMTNVMFPAPGRYRMRIGIGEKQVSGPSLHLIRSPEESN